MRCRSASPSRAITDHVRPPSCERMTPRYSGSAPPVSGCPEPSSAFGPTGRTSRKPPTGAAPAGADRAAHALGLAAERDPEEAAVGGDEQRARPRLQLERVDERRAP